MSFGSDPDPLSQYSFPYAGLHGGGDPRALAMIKPPAIAMLVFAGLGVVFLVLAMLFILVGDHVQPVLPPNANPRRAEALKFYAGFSGVYYLVTSLTSLAVDTVLIIAALKMMKLESRGFAIFAAILEMLPALSPCCCIVSPSCLVGIPLGIWTLVTLNDPIVKRAFH